MRRWVWLLLSMALLCGCSVGREDTEKTGEVDFTVVRKDDIPKEWLTVIEEQKEEEMNLTYTDGAYLYIAKGYGRQDSGGYSVSVLSCYETERAVCVETRLSGPSGQETTVDAETCPYLVIKVEMTEKYVIFQ